MLYQEELYNHIIVVPLSTFFAIFHLQDEEAAAAKAIQLDLVAVRTALANRENCMDIVGVGYT